MSWQLLEMIFGVKDLKNSLSINGSQFKNKSNDYEKLKKILNTSEDK